jgi:hypothetical protein
MERAPRAIWKSISWYVSEPLTLFAFEQLSCRLSPNDGGSRWKISPSGCLGCLKYRVAKKRKPRADR